MRILFLTWRDTRNPEGGGSEVYLENVAATLAAAGHDVTVFCALFPGASCARIQRGRAFRAPGPKARGASGGDEAPPGNPTYGAPDITIDVQNGIPFFTPTGDAVDADGVGVPPRIGSSGPSSTARCAPGSADAGTKVSPYLYRDCLYIAACTQTKHELTAMGVGSGSHHSDPSWVP